MAFEGRTPPTTGLGRVEKADSRVPQPGGCRSIFVAQFYGPDRGVFLGNAKSQCPRSDNWTAGWNTSSPRLAVRMVPVAYLARLPTRPLLGGDVPIALASDQFTVLNG